MFYDSKQFPRPTNHYLAWLEDIADVQLNFRGIGFNFGKGMRIPGETRTLEHGAFLRRNCLNYVKGYLSVDLAQAFFRHVPGLSTPEGASIWKSHLPPLHRYALATLLHVAIGVVVQHGLEMNYDLGALICVGLFGQSPSS